MRLPPLLACLALAVLACAGVAAADPAPVAASVAPAPGLTGSTTLDLILAIVGVVNMAATALAALLPGNSTIGWIAKIAGIANTVGVTVKPKAVAKPTEPAQP